MPKLTREAFIRYWIPAICWMLVIAVESTMLSSDRTSYFVEPLLRWLFPKLNVEHIESIHHLGRKLGHFTGYGLMSYLIFRAIRGTHHVHHGTEDVLRHKIVPAGKRLFDFFWQWRWAAFAVFGTLLIAIADEVHQMGNPERTGTWWDVGLDTLGALAIQAIALGLIRWRIMREETTAAIAGSS